MQAFARLFSRLDQTNKTNAKVEALVAYFLEASDADKLWAIALFSGKRPRRPVNSRLLREWAAELTGIPDWLFEESYHVAGDLAETIALLLPPPEESSERGLADWMDFLIELRERSEEEKKEAIREAWRGLGSLERFVFNKLITGGFRVGVSQKLMIRALARYSGLEESALAHRLMGDWDPRESSFQEMLYSESHLDDISRPYPFFLAHPLEDTPDSLGLPSDWSAEWKWDGIRAQVIMRKGEWFLWSRGEELITDKFPDLSELAERLPNGTVIDGELLPYKEGHPLSFALLQTRIGRKNLSKKILEQVPAHIIAYDLLEWEGKDLRQRTLRERRALLAALIEKVQLPARFSMSEQVEFDTWQELSELRPYARDYHSEGFMLKRLDSPYRVGRKRGDWWKWKVDPLTIDGVMIYAQRGHGRRATLYTDYTFAVWKDGELVPFTKAYSGLTDEEILEVDAFVKKNTRERFGPVRSVNPELVFELAFEGIQRSTRHKSGVALRFPRILRWRQDKPAAQANTLEDLHKLMERFG